MKGWQYLPAALLALASLIAFTGCATNPNATKDRGVYTTLAMPGDSLEMPASGYTCYKNFSPNQTPAAVVVGYGFDDGVNDSRPQEFDLEVIEAASGTVILNLNGSAFANTATVCDLPIRKSGNYRLKLIIRNSVHDTWDFTVNRETSAGSATIADQAPTYAKGIFATGIEGTPDAFNEYDESLMLAFNHAVEKELTTANHDDFAQMLPGHVGIQFNLSETGQVSSPKICENTLNDTLGQFFLHALQNGAPYMAWPNAARAASGSSSRSVKVNFYYN